MWKFPFIGLLSAVVPMPAAHAEQPPPSLTLAESPTVVASQWSRHGHMGDGE